ncbi:MAG: DNA-binding protein YbiB, partial [Burkholderiaceae bacterium]
MQTDATHLTYAAAIRRLGRNPRPQATGVLEPEAAAALWSALLARRFSAAQEAALLMGLRVHGESAALLAALARATPVAAIAAPAGTVVISCSGAARKHPSAAPLLALHLVQQGIPVLILTATPGGRGNAAAVLTALGHTAATSTSATAQAITSTGLAWTALTTIAPALARVIALRAELGFRNSAHTVLKLIDPIDP